MKTLKNILKSTVLLCLFFYLSVMVTGCGSNKTNEQNKNGELIGTISISGAFALYPMGVKWADEFKKLHPGVKIDVSAGGAGKGMADALSGMIDLGMVSRGVKPEEEAKGAWKIAVTKDAVLPVINTKNPVFKELMAKGLTKEQFTDIFIKANVKVWGKCVGTSNNSKINVYTRSDACGAAEMWGKYLGSNQETLKGIGVFGDPGIADAVKKDVNGIGFNNVIYAYDINSRKLYEGMAIVPIDINSDGKIDENESFYDSLDSIMTAIQKNKYPSPPARDLYFVSKGKPMKKEVVEFLKWILTDGQKFVKDAGYVNLDDDKVKSELQKLN
jgi:phosphate transport system substrate-binding protein